MNRRARNVIAGAVLASALVASAGAGLSALSPVNPIGAVVRLGEGETRDKLNAMEAAPFPTEALAAIGVDHDGGVTIFVSVSTESAESVLAIRRLGRLEERLGRQGLRVIGVADEASADQLQAHRQTGLITAEIVTDTGGKFRETLLVGSDPAVHVMDRAGQLRFAQIDRDSAAGIASDLLRETAEEASGAAQRRAAAAAAGQDLFAEPAVRSSEDVPRAAYARANWPETNRGSLSAKDLQGQPLPVPLTGLDWISKKDRDPGEHVVVLDFWATWCGPCIAAQPKLVELQNEHKDDLMILAVGSSEFNEDLRLHQRYTANNAKPYYNVFDGRGSLVKAFQVRGIPHTVVMSTDGVIRWQGNPLSPDFEKAVAGVIAADPYINDDTRPAGDSASTQSETGGSSGPSASAIEAAYASQNWPDHNTGELYAKDLQGTTIADPLEGIEWLGSDTPDTEGKVTIVDFWATWCGPCKAFSPKLDQIQKRYSKDLVAVGLTGPDSRQSRGDVERYAQEHRVSYHYAYDEEHDLKRQAEVAGIPHVLVLSSDGVVRWQGFPNASGDFEQVVARIVAADRRARIALENAGD
ncbi:MAG: thioredoxin-like domain-containing protein [Phycisphaerales bacterium JB040]